FWRPNSFSRTVSPTTHTALPERSSASVKVRPAASSQLPASKYSLVLPATAVDQLLAWYTAVADLVTTGATSLAPVIWLRTASTSALLNGAPATEPGPKRWPGSTISRLLPMVAIWS